MDETAPDRPTQAHAKTNRQTTECEECGSESNDVINRHTNSGIRELCTDCADKIRACRGQTRGSQPPTRLARTKPDGGQIKATDYPEEVNGHALKRQTPTAASTKLPIFRCVDCGKRDVNWRSFTQTDCGGDGE